MINIDSCLNKLSSFVTGLLSSKEAEAILNIEIQPGMLGLNGYYIDKNTTKYSLRTKPDENIKAVIFQLHRDTALNDKSK